MRTLVLARKKDSTAFHFFTAKKKNDDARGTRHAYDVAVVSPHAHSTTVLSEPLRGGKAADAYEPKKSDKYTSLCAKNRFTFAPFVGETYGSWGESAVRVMSSISSAWSKRNCCSRFIASVLTQFRLSSVLMGAVARLVLRAHGGALPPSCLPAAGLSG
jgi:hypothetical protein